MSIKVEQIVAKRNRMAACKPWVASQAATPDRIQPVFQTIELSIFFFKSINILILLDILSV
jgi:hypothetical protein